MPKKTASIISGIQRELSVLVEVLVVVPVGGVGRGLEVEVAGVGQCWGVGGGEVAAAAEALGPVTTVESVAVRPVEVVSIKKGQ